jgi:hypothetical protein
MVTTEPREDSARGVLDASDRPAPRQVGLCRRNPQAPGGLLGRVSAWPISAGPASRSSSTPIGDRDQGPHASGRRRPCSSAGLLRMTPGQRFASASRTLRPPGELPQGNLQRGWTPSHHRPSRCRPTPSRSRSSTARGCSTSSGKGQSFEAPSPRWPWISSDSEPGSRSGAPETTSRCSSGISCRLGGIAQSKRHNVKCF